MTTIIVYNSPFIFLLLALVIQQQHNPFASVHFCMEEVAKIHPIKQEIAKSVVQLKIRVPSAREMSNTTTNKFLLKHQHFQEIK